MCLTDITYQERHGCPDTRPAPVVTKNVGVVKPHILPVSEYYRTFADMCNATITYYRTVRFKLYIVRHVSRNPKLFCKNL